MTVLQDMPMYLYQYDNNGNIVAFGYANHDGTGASVRETYTYDSLNQLVRTNSLLQNATWVYDYDDGGNILSKTKYEYTTGDLTGLTPVETINYTYGNENWGDLLTDYNGKPITYDAIGNPLTYDGWTYTWKDGRKLATASDGTSTLSYKYNADGIRTSKTVNGITTEYFLNGTQIIAQKTGDDIMWFYYDHDGTRIALEYQGAMYYYAYNLQGDVKYISDADGNVCGGYYYDDWGKVTGVFNSGPNTVATANPFRYRGYYYDTETELYYLNSRYYNPEWGRFISADNAISGSGQSVQGYNLFAYGFNNPINTDDSNGNWPKWSTILKAAAVVAVAAVVVTAVVVSVATFGVASVAATIAISTAITITAKATEVAVLQAKKSKNEGKSKGEIATNVVNALYDNGSKIIGVTPLTKATGYSTGFYSQSSTFKDVMEMQKLDGFSAKATVGTAGSEVINRFKNAPQYLSMNASKGSMLISYGFAALSVANTLISVFSDNPEERANNRNYTLQ